MRTVPTQTPESANPFASASNLEDVRDSTLIAWIAKSRPTLWSPALRAAAAVAHQTAPPLRLMMQEALLKAQNVNLPQRGGWTPPQQAEAAFATLRQRMEDQVAILLTKAIGQLVPPPSARREHVQPIEVGEACIRSRRLLDRFPVPPGAALSPRRRILKDTLDILDAVLDHALAVPAPDAAVWADIKVLACAALQSYEGHRAPTEARRTPEDAPEGDGREEDPDTRTPLTVSGI